MLHGSTDAIPNYLGTVVDVFWGDVLRMLSHKNKLGERAGLETVPG